ncbi:cohesin domain-containing protein [Peptostreptococcaceae bacterium AGR-M142]
MFIKNKLKLLMTFVFIIFTFVNIQINSYAFDGNVLQDPEQGWFRHYFSSSIVDISGDWSSSLSGGVSMSIVLGTDENGNRYYKNFDENSKIEFKFKGTALRVLGPNKKPYYAKYRIMIDDDIDEIFFVEIEEFPKGMPVLFEINDLENKEHEVTIIPLNYPETKASTYSSLYLKGIDIDGELLSKDDQNNDDNDDIDVELEYEVSIGEMVGNKAQEGWSRSLFIDDAKYIELNEHMHSIDITGGWISGHIMGGFVGAEITGFVKKDEDGNEIFKNFDPESKIEFTFEGTGFRILSTHHTQHNTYRIKIDDDIIEEFEIKNTDGDIDYRRYGLAYEKMNLENKIHKVTITPLDDIGEKWGGMYSYKIAGFETTNRDWSVYQMDKVLDIDLDREKIKIDDEITTNLIVDNVKKITAEDIRIKYSSSKLEFLGYKEVEGIKLVKSIKNGNEIRVVLSSKGEANIINDREILLKLRFKGIDKGDALIKVSKGRVTDGIELEKELEEGQCGKVRIKIKEKKMDVDGNNRFTLVDLGIEGRGFNKDPNSPELSGYNTDIVEDGVIDELDLLEIGRKVLESQN